MERNCSQCDEKFVPSLSNIKKGGGKFCSQQCYHKQATSHKKGVNSPFWKGAIATVHSIHDALKNDRGRAKRCTNILCKGKSNTFDWALKKGAKYEDRNHSDYIELCRRCHKAYDFSEKKHPRNSKGIFI